MTSGVSASLLQAEAATPGVTLLLSLLRAWRGPSNAAWEVGKDQSAAKLHCSILQKIQCCLNLSNVGMFCYIEEITETQP